ncbi:GFA family protein [soil metagenome]
MIEGSCICGSVRWQYDGVPEGATACNCTACRRYGVLWAYHYENEGIRVSGETKAFVRGEPHLEFHFCVTCGNVSFWRGLHRDKEGRLRIAVNLRQAEPDAVADIPIDHFEGLHAFDDLPRDGKTVRDYWF